MNENLYIGSLVRLSAFNAEEMAPLFAQAMRDSEYDRLLDTSPALTYSAPALRSFMEKELDGKENLFPFAIRALDDGRVVGEVGLDGVDWARGDTFVGIGIFERELWGKGYGTDAMRLVLRYAFQELNLRRVTLDVFGYNPRAVRSYEKSGFRHEGRLRQLLFRDGQRHDLIFMGILREEWEALQEK